MEILNNKGVPLKFRAGYKSEENYEYVRGRGRGKYVCEMCGIRCKKPSMLKKHLRTHTDYRPYQCLHCKFSFKTKGNLTKHMKSKVSEGCWSCRYAWVSPQFSQLCSVMLCGSCHCVLCASLCPILKGNHDNES